MPSKKIRIEEILPECVAAIKAGTADVDGCLNRYPSLREELEPLLKIALSMPHPSDIHPTQDFKVRARASLMQQVHEHDSATKPAAVAPVVEPRRKAYAFRLKTATVALAVVAAICGSGGGLAYASQDSLPGDSLYPVKLATEQIRHTFTFNDAAQVELELGFADTRLGEMAAVANGGNERLETAVSEYWENIALALGDAERIGDISQSADALEAVALAISGQIERLDSVEDETPPEAGLVVGGAKETALKVYSSALRGLAAHNPVRAAEINLTTMESRLNRAQTKAGLHQVDKADAALREFGELSRLGEEISGISKGLGADTAVIDEMNARAAADHLRLLGAIYGNMPESTKGTVEDAMTSSVETYDQAVKGLQEKGLLGDMPEQPPIPDDIPENVKDSVLNHEPNGSSGSSGGSDGSGNGRH